MRSGADGPKGSGADISGVDFGPDPFPPPGPLSASRETEQDAGIDEYQHQSCSV